MRKLCLAREKHASSRIVCSGAALSFTLLACYASAPDPSGPDADDISTQSDPTRHDDAAGGSNPRGQETSSSSTPAPRDSAQSADAGPAPANDQPLLPAAASKQLPGKTVSGKDDCVTWTGDLAGYQLRDFNELLNNPRAGDPHYAYLISGKEAVELQGPTLLADDPLDAGAYKLTALSARVIDPPTLYPDWSRDIYEATLAGPSGLLRYVVHGDDLEGEVKLARVRLCRAAGELTSHFVLAAAPDFGGVAHNLTIHALLDATPLRTTAPVWIEVRPE